jgi:hypothetical protein
MSWYRITIRGRLTDRFAPAFEGMGLIPEPDQTSLVGLVDDQAHLYGILDRIRSLGLDLISVEPSDQPWSPSAPVTSPSSGSKPA